MGRWQIPVTWFLEEMKQYINILELRTITLACMAFILVFVIFSSVDTDRQYPSTMHYLNKRGVCFLPRPARIRSCYQTHAPYAVLFQQGFTIWEITVTWQTF